MRDFSKSLRIGNRKWYVEAGGDGKPYSTILESVDADNEQEAKRKAIEKLKNDKHWNGEIRKIKPM